MWDDLTFMDVSNNYGFIIIANLFTWYHLSKLPRWPMSIGPCAFVLVIKAPNGIFGICSHCTNTSYCKYYNWHNQGLRESFRTAVKNWKFKTDQCLLFLEIWKMWNWSMLAFPEKTSSAISLASQFKLPTMASPRKDIRCTLAEQHTEMKNPLDFNIS